MNYEILDTYELVSFKAAEIVADTIKNEAKPVLGLATGSTPKGMYKYLIQFYNDNQLSFKNVITYNLDEYIGLNKTHPKSYHSYMNQYFFNHIDIVKDNTHLPNNDSKKITELALEYNQILNKNIIDIQILGIGQNGHIGFNEPNTPFDQETFIVELDDQTRKDNARFFDSFNKVPSHAITMGIKNIMRAKKIVIIASGEKKADAVKAMIEGPITPSLPASILQTHPNCVVVLDKVAAAKLNNAHKKE